ASVFREFAFQNAAAAVVIVPSQIKTVTKWPAALESPRFAEDKKGVRGDAWQPDRFHGGLQPPISGRDDSRQRAVYRELFAKIDAVCDQVVKQVNADENRTFLSKSQSGFRLFQSVSQLLMEPALGSYKEV